MPVGEPSVPLASPCAEPELCGDRCPVRVVTQFRVWARPRQAERHLNVGRQAIPREAFAQARQASAHAAPAPSPRRARRHKAAGATSPVSVSCAEPSGRRARSRRAKRGSILCGRQSQSGQDQAAPLKLGQGLARIRPALTNLGRHLSNSAELGQGREHLARLGPHLAKVGLHLADSGQTWAKVGAHRPMSDFIGSPLAKSFRGAQLGEGAEGTRAVLTPARRRCVGVTKPDWGWWRGAVSHALQVKAWGLAQR